MDDIANAYQIAVRDLRACYGPKGIYAGGHQFKDYWSRDSFFSSLAALEIGDHAIVKANLENFLSYQKEDGMVPLRIGSKNMVLKLIGFKGFTGPVYGEDKHGYAPADPGSLMLHAAAAYVRATDDRAFAKKHLAKFRLALAYNRSRYAPGTRLMQEDRFCGWADSIAKQGSVFYSSLCNWEAHRALGALERAAGHPAQAAQLAKESVKLAKEINRLFWTGRYFRDWVHTIAHDNFATGENYLAILWGLASPRQAKSIMATLLRLKDCICLNDVAYPQYHKKHWTFLLRPMMMADYHSGMHWLWIDCCEALCWARMGNHARARKLLTHIGRIILRAGTVQEVYEHSELPVHRLFYHSENPFAWNSALYIIAARRLEPSLPPKGL